MNPTYKSYALIGIRVLVSLAFLAAGTAKLMGVEMMVATFNAVGVGQWFRYVTGTIEIVSAILLWVPGLQLIGAGLLVCTMIGAVLAHIFLIGPTAVPAIALGLLSAILAYNFRGQMPGRVRA
jgi:putative oxidoreductase